MTTTATIKFKKSDNLPIRVHAGYKQSGRKRIPTTECRMVSGYEFKLDDGHPVFVHKNEKGEWGVTDPHTGMKIHPVDYKTRAAAVEAARNYTEKFAAVRETDKYKDLCRYLGILMETGEALTVEELSERHMAELSSSEDKQREEAASIADSISLIYEWLYEAKVHGDKYLDYVDRGEQWANAHSDMLRYIIDARGGDPITSDREFAALAFAVTHTSPLDVLKDERHDTDSDDSDGSIAESNPVPESVEDFRRLFEARDISISQKRPGTCIWASGNTRPFADELKGFGFKWSPKRKAWYLRAS